MELNEALRIIKEYCENKTDCESCKFSRAGICAFHYYTPGDYDFLICMEEKDVK